MQPELNFLWTYDADTVAEVAVARDIRRVENRTRINVGEDDAFDYWACALGITKERRVEIVRQVGDFLAAVRAS